MVIAPLQKCRDCSMINKTEPIHPHPDSCKSLGYGLLGTKVKKRRHEYNTRPYNQEKHKIYMRNYMRAYNKGYRTVGGKFVKIG